MLAICTARITMCSTARTPSASGLRALRTYSFVLRPKQPSGDDLCCARCVNYRAERPTPPLPGRPQHACTSTDERPTGELRGVRSNERKEECPVGARHDSRSARMHGYEQSARRSCLSVDAGAPRAPIARRRTRAARPQRARADAARDTCSVRSVAIGRVPRPGPAQMAAITGSGGKARPASSTEYGQACRFSHRGQLPAAMMLVAFRAHARRSSRSPAGCAA